MYSHLESLVPLSYYCWRSVAKTRPTLCNPMDCSKPGLPVPYHLSEFAQVHVYQLSDAIQLSHPLLLFSSAFNLPQHQVFSNESTVHIRQPKYWSSSFSIHHLTTSKSLSVSSNTVYSVPGNFRNHVSLLISFSTPSMAPSTTTLLDFLQDPDPQVLASQHCVYSRLCHQQRAPFRHHDASLPCIYLLLWRCHTACGSLVPRPETEPGPQPWKCRVLTAGPPGKSRSAHTLTDTVYVGTLVLLCHIHSLFSDQLLLCCLPHCSDDLPIQTLQDTPHQPTPGLPADLAFRVTALLRKCRELQVHDAWHQRNLLPHHSFCLPFPVVLTALLCLYRITHHPHSYESAWHLFFL